MKKSLVLKFLLLVGAVCLTCQNARAGLFDSLSSQISQVVKNASNDQQQNSQTAQESAPEQAAVQQESPAQPQQQAQQQASQQPQDQAPQPTNPSRAPFKCKFSDFNWGDTVMATKVKLLSRGKQIKEAGSITMVNVGEIKGQFLTYDDVLFEMPCTVTLGFSLKTGKLGLVDIDLPPNSALDTLSDALTKKYGTPDQQGQGGSMWGGTENNEDTLSLTVNYVSSGNEFLLEYLSGEFLPLLKGESEEKTNSLVNQDAAKL